MLNGDIENSKLEFKGQKSRYRKIRMAKARGDKRPEIVISKYNNVKSERSQKARNRDIER